jgi:WD40 repeat protein
MIKKLVAACVAVGLWASIPAIAAESPLTLQTAIPLPGVKGAFDHFAADLDGNRLFLAAEENKTVEVFDLKSGEHLQSIQGFDTPHAIVYEKAKNVLYVTDSGVDDGTEGYIRVVSGDSYKITNSIKVLPAADSAGYDAEAHRMYADTGGLEAKMDYTVIAVIDTMTATKVSEMKVDSGRVEAINFEHNGSRIFANLRTKGQVGVFDKSNQKLLNTWSIPDASENVPMTLNEANHRLFVVCRKPARLVVFDTASGKVVASLPSVDRADDMAYDSANKMIYVSGGDGFVGVFPKRSRPLRTRGQRCFRPSRKNLNLCARVKTALRRQFGKRY